MLKNIVYPYVHVYRWIRFVVRVITMKRRGRVETAQDVMTSDWCAPCPQLRNREHRHQSHPNLAKSSTIFMCLHSSRSIFCVSDNILQNVHILLHCIFGISTACSKHRYIFLTIIIGSRVTVCRYRKAILLSNALLAVKF